MSIAMADATNESTSGGTADDKLKSSNGEAAKHIRILNGINLDITAALSSAGTAVSQLIDNSTPSTQSERHDAFLTNTKEYYSKLKSIRDMLVAEVDALEEAGLIRPDRTTEQVATGVTNGGLGNLDVGWLNARSRDVGAAKEAELLKEARELLTKMVDDKSSGEEATDVEMKES